MPCTHIPLWFLNCLTLIECVFFLWCRWGTACLWGSGGSAVSKTPLSTATSDKGDLAGLPPRSPPLPSEVCVLELQLGRLLPSLVFLVVPRPGSYSGAITDSLINTFIVTWPAANIVPAFNLPFGPFLSFGDLSADNVWWPLRNPPVTMATEGRLAGQALELLQPNIVYRTRLNVCVCVWFFFMCDYFQSGGEVYRWRTWVSHSRRGQRGPVFLHPAELHWARYGKRKTPSVLIATSSTSFCNKIIETNVYRKMVQRPISGMKLSEKKCTLTKKSNTLNHVHPDLKDASFMFCFQGQSVLQPLELLVLTLGKWSQRK